MSNHLEGRVAAVTGAGNGIGRAVALALARHGARVVVNDYGGKADGVGNSRAAAESVVEEIKAMGGQAVPEYGSVALMSTGENIVRTAVKTWGRLDIMCCFAGILRAAPIWEMTEDQWDQLIAVHLKGSFTCARYASAQMRDQKYGRLIFCSSEAGMGGSGAKLEPNYAAAKGGIHGLTLACALDLAPYNVTSNSILPRARTRMNDEYLPNKEAVARGKRLPVGKQQVAGTAMDPANVAPACVWLASEEAGWVSGYGFWAWDHQITLMARPHTQRTVYRKPSWDTDTLFAQLKAAFEPHIKPVPSRDDEPAIIMGAPERLLKLGQRLNRVAVPLGAPAASRR